MVRGSDKSCADNDDVTTAELRAHLKARRDEYAQLLNTSTYRLFRVFTDVVANPKTIVRLPVNIYKVARENR